jgi:glycosyltransferase involved in cell wall biosynthesis
VVCDGTAPEAAQLARARSCRVIEMTGPRGPAAARNTGAGAALHPILFFIDSDVEVPPTAIAQVWEHFERDATLSALFGSYDSEPSESSFLSQYRNLLHHFVHQTSSENASTFWGACGAIRREAFLDVSGFDERYLKPSIEDIELGYRLKGAGCRILLDRTLQVKHLKRWDMGSILRTDVWRRALPWGTLILEQGGAIRDLNLSRSSQWSVIAVAALLATLLGTLWYPPLFLACPALLLLLLFLNQSFYRFLAHQRGVQFAVRAIPCHWLFYVCGGLGFSLAVMRRATGLARRRRRVLWGKAPTTISTETRRSCYGAVSRYSGSVLMLQRS